MAGKVRAAPPHAGGPGAAESAEEGVALREGEGENEEKNEGEDELAELQTSYVELFSAHEMLQAEHAAVSSRHDVTEVGSTHAHTRGCLSIHVHMRARTRIHTYVHERKIPRAYAYIRVNAFVLYICVHTQTYPCTYILTQYTTGAPAGMDRDQLERPRRLGEAAVFGSECGR